VMIERVFCNLLENAAKYSPPGSRIEINVGQRDGCAEVAVCDTGQGFGKADNPALFEMFVRGDRESSTPGVGLGLAICRAIIEAHAGTLSADDRVQGGACVRFTLPLGQPPTIKAEALSPDAEERP
jgi:two-component system sensor histidine kinase KdpD